ncbi:maleylpyruvate isomerase family mycothiol-dependent enzyme [Kibdelosporangium phytohabitans]|uniref:Mycothiol-dependent maleylpyruvate isomerase metal-binding domain-containing protein n=1 Tax=Kibdelosporangium phytohabitans TaxID=860235 RepID=A0A0N9I5C3_9PSEU|nr:maleylpyruvate isomerase family mycothiol-dependent enzyme [Kibdelosporangium phytohabitans]ALG10857.1 hypothetical protein AOZ06_31780 [Kibdelosporangium phytohabitans]MBE1462037.1 maleylpyruvate isomerase [Kibdelosporangium phytohabitans]
MPVRIPEVAAGHVRLATLLTGLTDAAARADSALPGWSRGHVLTHLAELARALTRQVEHALDGKLVDMYDGGQDGRAAAIAKGAGRPARDLADDVVRSAQELETAWSAVGPADWRRPVAYRDGALVDIVLARWREVEIHSADLLLGPVTWSAEFSGYLIGFLATRVPPGTSLVLPGRVVGTGRPVRVTGELADVAAWLAGRSYAGDVSCGEEVRLGPWP